MSRCVVRYRALRGRRLVRCPDEATHGAFCEVHAELVLDALPAPERHVCECNQICRQLLRERFGETVESK